MVPLDTSLGSPVSAFSGTTITFVFRNHCSSFITNSDSQAAAEVIWRRRRTSARLKEIELHLRSEGRLDEASIPPIPRDNVSPSHLQNSTDLFDLSHNGPDDMNGGCDVDPNIIYPVIKQTRGKSPVNIPEVYQPLVLIWGWGELKGPSFGT